MSIVSDTYKARKVMGKDYAMRPVPKSKAVHTLPHQRMKRG